MKGVNQKEFLFFFRLAQIFLQPACYLSWWVDQISALAKYSNQKLLSSLEAEKIA